MKQHYVMVAGEKCYHTGIKVWYVLCGTNGKKVEWAWLVGPSHHKIEVVHRLGWSGYSDPAVTFFTRDAAVNDWRRRAAAETTEHADAIAAAAAELDRTAKRLRASARPAGHFHDL